mgnify:CR=1 FL=1
MASCSCGTRDKLNPHTPHAAGNRRWAYHSYDPIRCQWPQWPRRPLAIGRRGLPLNPSRSAPGMSSTLRLSLISADTAPAARNPLLRRGSPSLTTRMRPLPRAQRKRGYPRRLPGSPGRGLCLFGCLPAHRAEGPQPPHELGGGGGVRLRLGHAPGEHLLAAPEQALGTLPRASSPRAGRRCPWASASVGGSPGRSSRTPRRPAS